ncbi:hypothetical protein [Micromonospora sp. NPDC049102]|uniref:hypothetical protein n=1 Tax=Micromonospora sp. NPDC049102 TaxID=3364265 RepID=UPI0037110297
MTTAETLYGAVGCRRRRALSVEEYSVAVRAAFDLSYRALSAPAARLFRLLGLFPGPAPS